MSEPSGAAAVETSGATGGDAQTVQASTWAAVPRSIDCAAPHSAWASMSDAERSHSGFWCVAKPPVACWLMGSPCGERGGARERARGGVAATGCGRHCAESRWVLMSGSGTWRAQAGHATRRDATLPRPPRALFPVDEEDGAEAERFRKASIRAGNAPAPQSQESQEKEKTRRREASHIE